MPKNKKKAERCRSAVTLHNFLYVCEREAGHKLGHFATAQTGQTIVKVGWFDKDTLN